MKRKSLHVHVLVQPSLQWLLCNYLFLIYLHEGGHTYRQRQFRYTADSNVACTEHNIIIMEPIKISLANIFTWVFNTVTMVTMQPPISHLICTWAVVQR